MKKLVTAFMLLVGIGLSAQPKEVNDALKAVAKAKATVEHQKKGLAPKNWLTLSRAYTTLFDAPTNSILPGASQLELKVLLKDQKILRSEEVMVNGTPYIADYYSDKVLFYSQNGELAAWDITNPYSDEPLLERSYEALNRAVELDERGRLTKDIVAQMEAIKSRFVNDAMNAYTIGKFTEASINFEQGARLSQHQVLNQIDTALLYYAGLTAFMDNGNHDRAIKFFEEAIDNGYDAEGDAYSYLAESYKAKDDLDKAKEILNQGFTKYPSAQSILVSLINAYIESNDDPEKILDLIHQAQENEPGNATLHYAEGNVWKNLGDLDKAIEGFRNSIKIDPNYYFGYFAIGAAYYDHAVELQTAAADEMDDAKYEEIVKELEESLIKAIEPFERCFEESSDQEIKDVVAEYLKNIYFRFREKSDEYMEGFEKYNQYSHKE